MNSLTVIIIEFNSRLLQLLCLSSKMSAANHLDVPYKHLENFLVIKSKIMCIKKNYHQPYVEKLCF